MTTPAIELHHIHREYWSAATRTIALDGVTLSIDPGTSTAFMGPSGSGKSTLLHLVGAIDSPTSGTLSVAGTELTTLKGKNLVTYRRQVGFIFQNFHLLPALSALDNVIAPVLPRRIDFDRNKRGRELLAAVGLADRADALPSQLSGGQQQRVAIARSLVNQPIVLLADEPTGNLDQANGEAVLDLLLDLRATRGTTLLIATHDRDVARRCDRIISLRDGKVVDDDHQFAGGR